MSTTNDELIAVRNRIGSGDHIAGDSVIIKSALDELITTRELNERENNMEETQS